MANQLSKNDIEILKKFDIENPEICSIVKDFNLMLNYVIEKKLPLTANNVISSVVFKEINGFLSHKIEFNKPKVFAKSYPNVIAMFLLLRLSGLTKIEKLKSKNVLVIENDFYEKWKTLNKTEQFFHILKTIVFNFTLEPINEKKGDSFYNYVISEFAKNNNIEIKKNDNLFNYFETKINISIYEQLGFITTSAQLNNEGNWEYTNIKVLSYGKIFFNYFIEKIRKSYNNEKVIKQKFDDEMKQIFPNYINKIKFKNKIIKDSNFIFEVSLKHHNLKLKISISSEAILDQLCIFILDCLDFDYDHLYSVEMKNNLGQTICFDGSAYEKLTTETIIIGKLPIRVGSSMLYTYDFGENWEFDIKLLEIENADVKLEEPKLLELKGEIPQQYEYFDDDDEYEFDENQYDEN